MDNRASGLRESWRLDCRNFSPGFCRSRYEAPGGGARDLGRFTLYCLLPVHAANSIHSVPPFIDMLHRLIRKEKAGEYPGGAQYQFQRRAFLGGLVFFWVKRGLRARLYKKVCKLLASGAPLVAAGFASRVGVKIKKLRPVEAVRMPVLGPAPDEQIVNGDPVVAASKSSF